MVLESALLTFWTNAGERLGLNPGAPRYLTLMLCTPIASGLPTGVVKLAEPAFKAVVVSVAAPSRKTTFPVGVSVEGETAPPAR